MAKNTVKVLVKGEDTFLRIVVNTNGRKSKSEARFDSTRQAKKFARGLKKHGYKLK